MNKSLTKVFLVLITICLIFICVVIIHEIRAKDKYEEWVQKEVESTQRIDKMFHEDYRTDDEIEREVRQEGNPYSWFK